MPIYSKKLARGTLASPTLTTVFTAPTSGTVVLRDVVLTHDQSTPRRLALICGTGSGAAYIVVADGVQPFESLHWDGRQVLEPGEEVKVLSNVSGNVFFSVSGYLLLP